jgi:hypothetical protein
MENAKRRRSAKKNCRKKWHSRRRHERRGQGGSFCCLPMLSASNLLSSARCSSASLASNGLPQCADDAPPLLAWLDAGSLANVNALDMGGRTPLATAMWENNGNLAIIGVLLQHGGDAPGAEHQRGVQF